jgi:hypothetical protein
MTDLINANLIFTEGGTAQYPPSVIIGTEHDGYLKEVKDFIDVLTTDIAGGTPYSAFVWGPWGFGKSFIAKRIVYEILELKDNIQLVNPSTKDFILPVFITLRDIYYSGKNLTLEDILTTAIENLVGLGNASLKVKYLKESVVAQIEDTFKTYGTRQYDIIEKILELTGKKSLVILLDEVEETFKRENGSVTITRELKDLIEIELKDKISSQNEKNQIISIISFVSEEVYRDFLSGQTMLGANQRRFEKVQIKVPSYKEAISFAREKARNAKFDLICSDQNLSAFWEISGYNLGWYEKILHFAVVNLINGTKDKHILKRTLYKMPEVKRVFNKDLFDVILENFSGSKDQLEDLVISCLPKKASDFSELIPYLRINDSILGNPILASLTEIQVKLPELFEKLRQVKESRIEQLTWTYGHTRELSITSLLESFYREDDSYLIYSEFEEFYIYLTIKMVTEIDRVAAQILYNILMEFKVVSEDWICSSASFCECQLSFYSFR